MNTREIYNILQNNRFTKDVFKGVYPSNNIPFINHYPFLVIVNTDRYGEPGTHWVAIYAKNENHAEYFDSFGEKPNRDIEAYLERFKHLNINTSKVQSVYDNSCGAHVIYYGIQKCRDKSLQAIIRELDGPFNDSLVKLYVYNLIKL